MIRAVFEEADGFHRSYFAVYFTPNRSRTDTSALTLRFEPYSFSPTKFDFHQWLQTTAATTLIPSFVTLQQARLQTAWDQPWCLWGPSELRAAYDGASPHF